MPGQARPAPEPPCRAPPSCSPHQALAFPKLLFTAVVVSFGAESRGSHRVPASRMLGGHGASTVQFCIFSTLLGLVMEAWQTHG